MADMIPRQKLDLICKTFLFQQVNEIVVEQMVSDQRCFQQRYAKGETIYNNTQFHRCLGILLSGSVRVEKITPEQKRLKMSVLGPGECFGAAAMFHHRVQYPAVLTAKKSVEILFLPEELISWAMRRDFTITENYIRYLSNRIWFLHEKISDLTAGSAAQRLSVFLTEHCSPEGTIQGSMTDLSRQLNIGRATLYRALDALEKEGIIRREHKCLQILDPRKLREFSTK